MGIDRVHLVGHLLAEGERQALAACHVHLAVIQGCQQVGRTGHAQDVGIGRIVGDGKVLDAAHNHSHALALQCLEYGRYILLLGCQGGVILRGRRLQRTGEYPSLALARDEQDVRLDITVGEEHLLLPLLGDADGSHGQVGLACLYGRHLSGEVHHEKFQFPIPTVGPFHQQGRL